MLGRTLNRHFSAPRGILGQMAARYTNRLNARMHATALRALAPAPGEQALEIGFGRGHTLRALADRVAPGAVTGVDPSATRIEQARRSYPYLVEARRLELAHGTAEALPFAEGCFDLACSIDTIYGWTSPQAGLAEIGRVLRPGGRLALVFHPWEALQRRRSGQGTEVRLYAHALRQLLETAGFCEVRVQLHGPETYPFACTIGERPLH